MKKRITVTILLNISFILLVFMIILPTVWLIMNLLKTNVELFTDFLALPAKIQLANYISAWSRRLYKYFENSIIVSSISLISALFLSSLLVYGITRFNSRFGNLVLLTALGGTAPSGQVALAPLYKILHAAHLYNTCWTVTLPYAAFRIPFTVFLIRAYFTCIPKELKEVAVIDGYNSFQAFRKIIVPTSKSIFTPCAVVNLSSVWSESLSANVFPESRSTMTIPIGLMISKGDMKSDYVVILTDITIVSLLMIILYLCI